MDIYSGRYEEDVELIDILKVIWKRRYLLVGGLIFLIVVASILCLSLEKVYRTTMMIQPGGITTDDNGKWGYIDPIETVAGRIGAGIYNDEIIAGVLPSDMTDEADGLKFKVEIPKQSDVILVSYDNSDSQLGAAVLAELFRQIQNQERRLLDQFRDHYGRKISLAKIEFQKHTTLEQSYAANIRNLAMRIMEARSDIAMAIQNNITLVQEKKKLLGRGNDAENALSLLFYNNAIQQNIQYVNSVKQELSEHMVLKEEGLQKIIQGKKEQEKINAEILNMEKIKNSVRPVVMLRKPTADRNLVKPNKLIIFVLTLFTGFFIILILIFFIEYVRNNIDISDQSMVVKEMESL